MKGFLRRLLIYIVLSLGAVFIIGFGARWLDNRNYNSREADIEEASGEDTNQESQQEVDLFARGLELGYEAAVAAQSANTREDWELVSQAWNKAINILSRVGQDSPDHEKSKAKMQEYQANKKVADERAQSLPASAVSNGDTAPTSQLIDKGPGEWYEGGNLHDASALDWQQATYENKLATCSDFIASVFEDGLLTPELSNAIKTVDDFRPLADGCVSGLDNSFKEISDPEDNRSTFANQKVSDTVSLIMLSAGWIK